MLQSLAATGAILRAANLCNSISPAEAVCRWILFIAEGKALGLYSRIGLAGPLVASANEWPWGRQMNSDHIIVTLFVMAAPAIVGCQTTMTINPPLQTSPQCQSAYYGRVDFQGQDCYLPRSVSPSTDDHSQVAFHYEYGTAYSDAEVPAVVSLYSPTTLVGVPLGSNDVLVWATMKVIHDGKEVRVYTASCRARKMRNIFSEGETLTSIRQRALLALRDNIEAQMHNDRVFLGPIAGTVAGDGKESSTK